MDVRPKRLGKGRNRRGPSESGLIVYTIKGHPACERLERFLASEGIPYRNRDVFAHVGVMEELAGRTRGRVRLPAVRIGDSLLESQTPGSLSRILGPRRSRKAPPAR